MPRVSFANSRRIAELSRTLDVVQFGDRALWDGVATQLKPLLGSAVTQVYGIRAGQDGQLGPAFWHSAELSPAPLRVAVAALTRQQLLAYDPLLVPAGQRNRAMVFAELGITEETRENGHCIIRQALFCTPSDQLRLLVCEGSAALAWVGGFAVDGETFSPQRRRLLQALAEPLSRRLIFEERLRRLPLLEATLHTALEALEGPAHLVDASGRVVLSNGAGRLALERYPGDCAQGIREALSGEGSRFAVTEVRGAGLPVHHLLIARPDGATGRARRLHVSAQWELTPREAEVLSLVARGLTTAAIARELGCAARTIELHLTRVMEKAGVENRASLVAHFWGGAT